MFIIQLSKRIFIGVICFLVIFFLTFMLDERLGIFSLLALILMIVYPMLLDRILNKFFNDKLHKYKFLKRLHWIFWFFIMCSLVGTVGEGKKFSPQDLPGYLLILAIVFSIKKWRFIKKDK